MLVDFCVVKLYPHTGHPVTSCKGKTVQVNWEDRSTWSNPLFLIRKAGGILQVVHSGYKQTTEYLFFFFQISHALCHAMSLWGALWLMGMCRPSSLCHLLLAALGAARHDLPFPKPKRLPPLNPKDFRHRPVPHRDAGPSGPVTGSCPGRGGPCPAAPPGGPSPPREGADAPGQAAGGNPRRRTAPPAAGARRGVAALGVLRRWPFKGERRWALTPQRQGGKPGSGPVAARLSPRVGGGRGGPGGCRAVRVGRNRVAPAEPGSGLPTPRT